MLVTNLARLRVGSDLEHVHDLSYNHFRLENPMNPTKLLAGLLLVFLLAAGLVAQPTHEAALKNLKFREIGPAIMGGRVDDFAVVESDPRII